MLPLKAGVQNYDWGREASSSEVAQLAAANGASINKKQPYAELWMGTHRNCPSVVASTGKTLEAWVNAHPECLGLRVRQRFSQLPFLFKVLSVNKALSIQSHPDKQLAERLHESHPKMYADDNHKPEMALALSGFEALCGFAPLGELQHALTTVPELADCVGEGLTQRVLGLRQPDKQVLKEAFTALMTCGEDQVKMCVQRLVERLQEASPAADSSTGAADVASTSNGASNVETQQQQDISHSKAGHGLSRKEALALRLHSQFPYDVGVLSSFFLNYITLSPGQAISLAANEPHAYLSGELVECMATSDNVIRAGLTPKFKHTEVLCESLTYEQGLPRILDGVAVPLPAVSTTSTVSSNSHSASSAAASSTLRVYRPPFEEFEIRLVEVLAGCSAQLLPNKGPMLMLVQHGQGEAVAADVSESAARMGLQSSCELHRGGVLFVPVDTQLALHASAVHHPTAAPSTSGQVSTPAGGESSAGAHDSASGLSGTAGLRVWIATVNDVFFQLPDTSTDDTSATAASAATDGLLKPALV